MKIIIAPNAFKGSLSSDLAARSIAEGIRRSGLAAELTLFPVADGGDDTMPLLLHALKGTRITSRVHDPLGRNMNAGFGWIPGSRTAVIALSEASGLRLLKSDELDPLHASTTGSGELILGALGKGAKKMLIGVGGTATVDGGAGLLRALGVRFMDQRGKEITDLPFGLMELKAIDTFGMDPRLAGVETVILCDVDNGLLGKAGSAAVYGPQKGAGEKEVDLLERCLERLSRCALEVTGIDMAEVPSGGAAGGVAAGLAAFLGAKLVSGIDYFLDTLEFAKALQDADLVITGEGRIDGQTLQGKAPFGVARIAKARNIPVVAMAGQIAPEPNGALHFYFERMMAVNPPGISMEEAMSNTGIHLSNTAFQLGKELAALKP